MLGLTRSSVRQCRSLVQRPAAAFCRVSRPSARVQLRATTEAAAKSESKKKKKGMSGMGGLLEHRPIPAPGADCDARQTCECAADEEDSDEEDFLDGPEVSVSTAQVRRGGADMGRVAGWPPGQTQ
jgi:hypothetical protein